MNVFSGGRMKHLSDQALLLKMDNLVQQERELLTAVLAHLCEIQRRRLFCDLGFASLFDYAVKKLGYSHDQAHRRISAMRLVKQFPELEEKLVSGAMSLTNVSLAQNFFKREAPMTIEKKREFLGTLENKSSREAEKIILSASPKPITPDRITPVSADSVEIKFTAPARLQEKLTQLKNRLAHSHPSISLADLVEKLADLGLKEWDPGRPPKRQRKQLVKSQPDSPPNQFKPQPFGAPPNMENSPPNPAANAAENPVAPNNPAAPAATDPDRAIPQALKREAWARDQAKCCNCGSQHSLELDHIHPIALGGPSTPDNLRLLCKNCNQRAAIHKLGIKCMDGFIN